MYSNYDLLAFKMFLPEVSMLDNSCEVRLSFIGKKPEEQAQLAILSCQLTSFKGQVFDMTLQPDLIRVDSNARISAAGRFEIVPGFGLVNAKIKVIVADLLGKQQADIYFKRGSDRKWSLEGIDLMENVEIDRNVLREKRRKLRRTMGDMA